MKPGMALYLLVALALLTLGTSCQDVRERTPVERSSFFDPLQDWRAIPAPGTSLSLERTSDDAITLAYDFGRTKYAYVVAAKMVDMRLPDETVFSFEIRRSEPANHLEFKVADAVTNMYRFKWYACGPVDTWEEVVVRKSDLAFAWGPEPGRPLDAVRSIEFAITGGKKAGRLDIRNFEVRDPLEERPSVGKADRLTPGCYPRWWWHEQAYWTLAGIPDDWQEALICEDGTIEPHKYGFSVLPVLQVGDDMVTRDDVDPMQTLEDDIYPIPTVTWSTGAADLSITLLASGESGESVAHARYVISNTGERRLSGKLHLLIEPYQVYPPWHNHGGFSPIYSIRKEGDIIMVNDKKIVLLTKPERFGSCVGGIGEDAVSYMLSGTVPPSDQADERSGFASGLLEYAFDLERGDEAEVHLLFPLHEAQVDRSVYTEMDPAALFEREQRPVSSMWHELLGAVDLQIPDKRIEHVLKSNLAYILITQDGVGFQPGSRSYDQVWMRDGAVMGLALMRVGHRDAMREFIDYFEEYQFDDGEIPPIIDPKAEDPLWPQTLNDLIEYDSQGQYVWSVLHYYLFSGDLDWLEQKSGSVVDALKFLEALRAKRLTPEYRDDPQKAIFYGLLPPSDSHEGYKMKHSYWDDFWALRGWRDGQRIFRILGDTQRAEWCDEQYEALKESTYASMKRVMEIHNLERVPGCAELGDVDPPAAAAIVAYCDELLDRWPNIVRNTFDRFYEDFNARWTSPHGYGFGPYEVRTIPVLMLLGERDQAVHVLTKMLDSCRPAGWNHLAEVVRSGYRTPGYIGDMPHTWIGADLINAMCSLFAYEKDDQLILAHGLSAEWLLSEEGVRIARLQTHYGAVSYSISREENALVVDMGGSVTIPPKGVVFKFPLSLSIGDVLVDGVKVDDFEGAELPLQTWPQEIKLILAGET